MTAAIYYHPEAYTTSGPKLMGRNAAGESFLRGFLTHSKATQFWVQVQKPEHARHFAQTVQAFGRSEAVKAVDKNSLGALAQAGVVYYPGDFWTPTLFLGFSKVQVKGHPHTLTPSRPPTSLAP
jgi:hypothetical protein